MTNHENKNEYLDEPGISLTAMWFLFAILLSFVGGFITCAAVAPQKAIMVMVE